MASSCIPEAIGGSSPVVKEPDNSELNVKEPEKVEDESEGEDPSSEEYSSFSDEDTESENDVDILARDPLFRALIADDPDRVILLLMDEHGGLDGIDRVESPMCSTPLQFACRFNKMQCVEALIGFGASLLDGTGGLTPLHEAVLSHDPLPTIDCLVEAAKAKNDGTLSKMLTASSCVGITARQRALSVGKYRIVNYLNSIMSEEDPTLPNKRPKN